MLVWIGWTSPIATVTLALPASAPIVRNVTARATFTAARGLETGASTLGSLFALSSLIGTYSTGVHHTFNLHVLNFSAFWDDLAGRDARTL